MLSGSGFGEVPRHELVEVLAAMTLGELRERGRGPGERIDVVEATGLQQRSDNRPVLCPLMGRAKKTVLSRQGLRLDAAFDHIGVELDAPVVHEPGESVPVAEDAIDCLEHLAFDAEPALVGRQLGVEFIEDRADLRAAHREPRFRRLAAHLVLDPVDGREPTQDSRGQPVPCRRSR